MGLSQNLKSSLSFLLNRKKYVLDKMWWLQSKNTLSIPSISEKYLVPSVRLVNTRGFFPNKSQEKAGFERMILANREILSAKLVWDTWHESVMPWTRSSNPLAPPLTASDLFHVDKHWLMAVFSAGCALGKSEVSAIWDAVPCYLELDSAFHWY